jgi:molybdate transport system permease protein
MRVSGAESFPIWLSLRVATVAILVAGPVGLWLAWIQARKRYRLRSVVDALILLPLVLPPSVLGYALVVVFGRRGTIGQWLEQMFGWRVIFTPAAAVLAATVVALPILVKTAQPVIESVPPELEAVGRSLGLAPLAVAFRVTLRWSWRGVVTGLVLAFVRALGEFGATLMFAGNIPGETNTMSIEIFAAYQAGDDERALVYVTVLSLVSAITVWLAARLSPELRTTGGARAGEA